MGKVYYDLSELFLLSRGRLKFYGIARVVAEVAYEMHRLDREIAFVVFDESRRQFYELKPHFGKASSNGLVDLGLPGSAIPFRVLRPKPGYSRVGRILAACAGMLVKAANRLKFKVLDRYMKPVDLKDGYLITAGRPKLIADYIDHLKRQGSRTRLHVLLHDVMPLHEINGNPRAFQLNFLADNEKVIRYASHVIANSEFTAADLLEKAEEGILPPLPEYTVVPLAHECRPDGEAATIKLPSRPYVIGVGITLGRKNLDVILEAQKLLIDRGRTPPLMVVAGANRRRTMASLKVGRYSALERHVLQVNNPSQADLINLYESALATMMPSKLEGWGLPLGESLWLGTPAVAAPRSSLPEVGGDLAVYFDPDSPQELAGIFERLLDDPAYRAGLRARIAAAKGSLRTWRDVAVEMLATVPATSLSAREPVSARL